MAYIRPLLKKLFGAAEMPTATIEYTAGSFIGSRRANQDNLRAGRRVPYIRAGKRTAVQGTLHLQDMDLFCVCDGVGGGYRGDLAAKHALKAINRYWKQKRPPQLPLREILLEAADHAQEEVCSYYKTLQKLGGCTLAMLAVRGNTFAFLNIGDSPAYWIPANGPIREISCCHNMAWEKIRSNRPVEASDSRYLLRYLGDCQKAADMAHILEGTLEEGDHFLICSDGITNPYSPVSLEHAVRDGLTAEQIASAAALTAGADNCTAVCLTVREIFLRSGEPNEEQSTNMTVKKGDVDDERSERDDEKGS